MTDSVAGVALAAGAARRLRPISDVVPKPLCPVGNETLLERAINRLRNACDGVAVNVHHHADAVMAAVGERAWISHEKDEPLGTAGAVAALRDWIGSRAVAIVNADTYCPGDMRALLEGWDGATVRLWAPGGGRFGPTIPVVGCLLPNEALHGLEATPSGLYEVLWRPWEARGRLEVVPYEGVAIDCGTPRRLLEANLLAVADAPGGVRVASSARVEGTVEASAVGADAHVEGTVVESVIFPGAVVHARERLERVIRYSGSAGQGTVLVR